MELIVLHIDDQVREDTAKAKAQFDSAELSLQNLLYEKGHYLREIRACQSFRYCW